MKLKNLGKGGINTEENLSPIYEELVQVIGYENTLKIYEHFKGCQIYFPRKFISKRQLKKYVMEDYKNNISIKDLALKYSKSTRHIRSLLKK